MITVICYDKCSTCKKAMKFLDDYGVEYAKRDIKSQNPNYDELKQWYNSSGLALKRFFNTSGQKYREMGLKTRLEELDEDEQLKILASDGMLVKRPLLILEDNKILIGFKEKEWKEVI